MVDRADDAVTKTVRYQTQHAQLASLFAGERDALANAANTAAALRHEFPDLNWAGFYFLRRGELVLGRFQGKIADVRIAVGSGVCGTAAQRRESLIAPNVQRFPEHIACDAASRSEIVVPLLQRDRLAGMIDLDSPSLTRFDEDKQIGVCAIAALWRECSDYERLLH